MREKPILFTEHAVRRYVSLNLDPDSVRETIVQGKRKRLSKTKWSAARRTKKGTIVVIFAEYQDHIKVITISRGRLNEVL